MSILPCSARKLVYRGTAHFELAAARRFLSSSSASGNQNKKLLVLGYIWPELTSSAAGLRDINLVNSFQSRGWEVHYATASKENAFSKSLQQRGVHTSIQAPNDPSFDNWIAELSPDVVIFDRFVVEERFGHRVAEHSPRSVRVLDTQDLHFLRQQRQSAATNLDNCSSDQNNMALQESDQHRLLSIFNGKVDLLCETAVREVSAVLRSDLTLLISDYEMKLLTENPFHVDKELLHLSRLQYPPRSDLCQRGFGHRKHFAMIGNFRHAPNMDATIWMKKEVWPMLRAMVPGAELHIYGAYPSRDAMALTDKEEGFVVKGPVGDHLKMLSKYRVNLAPLRFGAGIKGKISDGWWCGAPCVTTPIGAEGMHGDLPFGGAVCSTAATIAETAAALYCDEKRWTEAREQGFAIIDRLYDSETISSSLVDRIMRTSSDLDGVRKRNFMGAMLSYHLHRSTKYFSQWIEAKNKIKEAAK